MMRLVPPVLANQRLLRGQLPALAGLALPLIVTVGNSGPGILGRIALIGLVVLFWQAAFARIRKQGFGLEGVTMAILAGLLVPEAAHPLQLLLGGTFGAVIGLLIFGGYGRNFLHPAVVMLAFLMFSFPSDGYRAGTELPLWTLAPALVLLLVAGSVNWRIPVAALIGLVGPAWLGGGAQSALDLAGSGLFALVVLYLVADPVASAATNWGRLIHGALFGVLVGLFLQAGTPFSAMIFAALMAAIFAPLIDAGVIAINAGRRARRHG